jgi:hypothetical protein
LCCWVRGGAEVEAKVQEYLNSSPPHIPLGQLTHQVSWQIQDCFFIAAKRRSLKFKYVDQKRYFSQVKEMKIRRMENKDQSGKKEFILVYIIYFYEL